MYSLLKLPLLGYEPKHAVFVFVPLNANELVLPAPFSEEGGASRAHAPAYRQQKPISPTENFKLSSSRLHIAFIFSYFKF